VEFEYDQAKSIGNQAKHGLDFEQAKALWSDPNRVEFMARFSDETRLGLVAQVDLKLWTAIFTTRGDRIRLISVRRARKNEEGIYNDRTGI
jgi:uncharacterized DUF497 family protein